MNQDVPTSLLIAWQLKGKRVLVVGGGEIAAQRIGAVLQCKGTVTLLAPAKGLHADTKRLIQENPDKITYFDRRFSGPAELHNMDLVLTSLDDNNKSREIASICRQKKVPVNAADIPDCCDFYFGAQIRDGPLQIMVSTNGNGPRMAGLVRTKLQHALDGTEGAAISKVGQVRSKLRERTPETSGPVSRKRMKWMSLLCNTWSLEELLELDDALQIKLLDVGWENGFVPSFEQLTGWPAAARQSLASATDSPTELPIAPQPTSDSSEESSLPDSPIEQPKPVAQHPISDSSQESSHLLIQQPESSPPFATSGPSFIFPSVVGFIVGAACMGLITFLPRGR